MAVDHVVKKGDTGIAITGTLSDENDVINLTGMTITVNMRKVGASTNKIDGGSASIVSAVAGTVTYTFAAADVNDPGLYNFEWVATNGSSVIHFPRAQGQDRFISVEVVDTLD